MTDRSVGDSDLGLYRATEFLMLIVFGVLLTSVPETLVDAGLASATYLITAVMLLFVEAYLILHTYYRRLRQPYDLTLFGFDIVLIGLFVTVVRIFEQSATRPEVLASGLWIGLTVFLLLFVRQLGPFNRARSDHAGLEAEELTTAALLTPMVADFAGVAVCIAILLAETETVDLGSSEAWAAGAFVAALLYFVVKYLLVIQISFGRRR